MATISIFVRNHDEASTPYARIGHRHVESNGEVWSTAALNVGGISFDFYLQPGEDTEHFPKALEQHKALRGALAKVLTELDELIQIAEERVEETEEVEA